MKRIWFGAALLILLLALGLGSGALMEQTHQAQAEDLTVEILSNATGETLTVVIPAGETKAFTPSIRST